eukprot:CAMPEP_0116574486 /NCGR_PEP_ID=MMETSP0397-20121206/19421_1 /TAXON_ID=216820 /ORGANISM="Cyclophora tenuis, Strain ECT3854" /LENGTH=360 /DNA_ID=CAMNT_0004103257 /DNA_START=81 /DNA_END=1163 /DNA_ORIENTATION=-
MIGLERVKICLCLDDAEDPCWSYRQSALRYWHGNISCGGNRWFDKPIQLVVSMQNGKMGYTGEHSMNDGMHALAFSQYLRGQSYKNQQSSLESTRASDINPKVSNVFQDLYAGLSSDERKVMEGLIDKAKSDYMDLVNAYDVHLESFWGYGLTYIKAAGFSPDAYIQMAIQLASYRLFGKQVGTYEATHVRPFLHGRTETIRSVTRESNAFVQAMGLRANFGKDSTTSRSTQVTLLHEATKSHVVYTRKAHQAQGVDRHFFGLMMAATDDSALPPALFSHPLFERSKRWRITSSSLPTTMSGFGPAVSDGVGVGYDLRDNHCFFTVTARKEHGFTDAFCHLVEEAMLEMKFIIEMEGTVN